MLVQFFFSFLECQDLFTKSTSPHVSFSSLFSFGISTLACPLHAKPVYPLRR